MEPLIYGQSTGDNSYQSEGWGQPYGTEPLTWESDTISRYVVSELEKAMAPHSSTLAWKIPWTEEPARLQSMGPLRVRRD